MQAEFNPGDGIVRPSGLTFKGAGAREGRLRVSVRGAVQGVGFRPFIFRLATEQTLRGWVNNSAQGVLIEVEGPRAQLERFLLRIETEKPPRSFVQSLEASWLDPAGYGSFEIRQSDSVGPRTALVLPDIATCPDCAREIFDPANRRYFYPFTNCTNCGPRFSIIESLPYDRANTSMKAFRMCPQCQAEYEDPRDRRFHAQPNACPVCGPRIELWDKARKVLGRSNPAPTGVRPSSGAAHPISPNPTHATLAMAADAIRSGQILALKGLGGFHLLVAAHDESAVARLRELKQREEKPFALIFPSVEAVKTQCEVAPLEERLLRSPECPIVLLRRRGQLAMDTPPLAASIAPHNPYLGVMLPYTPLHHLLLAVLGFPIVATSGNLSDEPICTDEHDALERLGNVADLFLVHNRPIVRHVDDSIARIMAGRELVLRRARGYAPLPIQLRSGASASVLGVGAHLKNTVALSVGSQVFISQHIGDLETDLAYRAFCGVIEDFERLYGTLPTTIAADEHPDYLSTRFARELVSTGPNAAPAGALLGGQRDGLNREEPLSPALSASKEERENPRQFTVVAHVADSPVVPRYVGVQHHLAHILSCMAENDLEPPLLGVSWDGTGYGLDNTVWGGEFFVVLQPGSERFAHLRPFPLPGGEQAVKEPRRTALGLLYEAFGEAVFEMGDLAPIASFSPAELRSLKTMLKRKLNSPRTSSAGRLFDAAASLAGLRQRVRFEGQAAMELEFATARFSTDDAYPLALLDRAGRPVHSQARTPTPPSVDGSALGMERSRFLVDWQPLLEAIVNDLKGQTPCAAIAARFHNGLVEALIKVARQAAQEKVLLSGGCFQNCYLTERTIRRLREEGFRPYWHQRVPPNDGGISLGQVIAALRHRV
ncbi:MAG TPA: carbamoyltransferase HypF [Verrucomicrobiae bacterium]|nr:carbamoyltransferase HypF [Verrucomicrobiae bacterium]